MMTIEFECGHVHRNVGMVGMAIRSHIGQCDNQGCQNELPGLAEKYQGVLDATSI